MIYEIAFATGTNFGDGTQASHWKDDELSEGELLGMMDPTLNFGVSYSLTPEDLRAYDAIGYQIVPEPRVQLLALLALCILLRPRRSRRAVMR